MMWARYAYFVCFSKIALYHLVAGFIMALMNTKKSACLLLAMLCAGCVDLKPTTQRTGKQRLRADGTPAEVVLLKFDASWCAPCKQQSQVIDLLKLQFPNVTYRTVNFDTQTDLVSKYDVTKLPTIVILVDGEVEKRFEGLQKLGTMSQAMNRIHAGPKAPDPKATQ